MVRWALLREEALDIGRRPLRPLAGVAAGVLPLIDTAKHDLLVVEAPIVHEVDAVLGPRVVGRFVGSGAASPHEQHPAIQARLQGTDTRNCTMSTDVKLRNLHCEQAEFFCQTSVSTRVVAKYQKQLPSRYHQIAAAEVVLMFQLPAVQFILHEEVFPII